MHIPRLGEHVWVRGCSHQFIVVNADYRTSVATLAPAEVRVRPHRCPFKFLFAMDGFEASQTTPSPSELMKGLLQTTCQCIQGSSLALRDLREAASRTVALIESSQRLIEQTDQTVARWLLLGCNPDY